MLEGGRVCSEFLFVKSHKAGISRSVGCQFFLQNNLF